MTSVTDAKDICGKLVRKNGDDLALLWDVNGVGFSTALDMHTNVLIFKYAASSFVKPDALKMTDHDLENAEMLVKYNARFRKGVMKQLNILTECAESYNNRAANTHDSLSSNQQDIDDDIGYVEWRYTKGREKWEDKNLALKKEGALAFLKNVNEFRSKIPAEIVVPNAELLSLEKIDLLSKYLSAGIANETEKQRPILTDEEKQQADNWLRHDINFHTGALKGIIEFRDHAIKARLMKRNIASEVAAGNKYALQVNAFRQNIPTFDGPVTEKVKELNSKLGRP